MSNENQTEAPTENTQGSGGDETSDDVTDSIAIDDTTTLTRNWPAPKPDGDDLMNPLGDVDFNEIFTTTVNQAFPTEEDFKTDDEKKAGPEDTAEDPIPEV